MTRACHWPIINTLIMIDEPMFLQNIVFYGFAGVALLCALGVIFARNAVYAVLLMVALFFATACLWLLMNTEFMALLLLFLYIGAVMTLFVFVIMMLNLDVSTSRSHLVMYLPLALLTGFMLVGLIICAMAAHKAGLSLPLSSLMPSSGSDTHALGVLIYGHYTVALQLAALILLVAVVGAISLSVYGRRKPGLSQNIREQQQVKPSERAQLLGIGPKQ